MRKKFKKVIDTSSPKDLKKESLLSFFMYAILGCLLLLSAALFYAQPSSQGQITKQVFSAENDHVLFAPTLLTASASPSATPSTVLPLVLSGETVTASASPVPATSPEYCIDVPVLMYHHVQPLPVAELLGHAPLTVDSAIFEEHIRYLKEQGYTFLSAETMVYALLNYQPLPTKPVVVTIDDGYDDNYTYAFLVGKKYNAIINFMIPSALIDKPGYMVWDHLKEMNQSPYAKIYNHTASHAPLGDISDQEIDNELASSSAAFKEQLGLNNTIVTYPYGSFSDVAIEKVKQHGFLAAFTTLPGRAQCRSQLLTLPRVRVGNAPLSTYGL